MLSEFFLFLLALLGQINMGPANNVVALDDEVAKESSISSLKHSDLISNRGPVLFESSVLSLDKSESFYLLDGESGRVLAQSGEDKKVAIASLSKIMTAIIVLEKGNLGDEVIISKNAFNTFGNKRGLVVGEKIKVGDLLQMVMIDSNNAAAVALSEHVGGSTESFVKMMNIKAGDLGLSKTSFVNPTGLDEENGCNISTAAEIAKLVDYAMGKDIIWKFSRMQKSSVYSSDGAIVHNFSNTNELLGEIDGIVGGKTGYTDKAKECLSLVVESPGSGGYVIGVILNSSDRFGDMENLFNWAFDVYRW